MPTNLTQQKRVKIWKISQNPHKIVATSVFHFWDWDCAVNDW